ncbi:hypothetical protein ACERK3_14315 [Phycisphaerales bacterium AB-hyl4]|uniref:Phytanoyl-CoA dioxygenase PhyH n=1 Tax=Natronomicrosphaera hydrolytica TaxID=3242702 RepID=A0ABV4U9H5_9BACT
MIGSTMDRLIRRPARYFYDDFMRRGGIGNTMRASKAYNRLRYASRWREHRRCYDEAFDRLLKENNGDTPANVATNVMRDGWAIDTSKTLPHLNELLDETDAIIQQRAGVKDLKRRVNLDKPFWQSLLEPGDLERCPSFLNFILSSPVLETIGRYMQIVPVLSKTMPPGVRFVESNAAFEDEPNPPLRSSQLFHLDIHDSPLVYVLVLLRDTTMEHGPWCFLPASVSSRAERALGYRRWRAPYRITDEQMYAHVDPKELIPFTYPRGTVLFIDTSRCFHYGSRNSIKPRMQMMYGFTSACRTDLTLTYMKPQRFPLSSSDQTLRKLVLQ